MATQAQERPNPERFFIALHAYQQTAAIRTAIELNIFTTIGEGSSTAAAIAGIISLWPVPKSPGAHPLTVPGVDAPSFSPSR